MLMSLYNIKWSNLGSPVIPRKINCAEEMSLISANLTSEGMIWEH